MRIPALLAAAILGACASGPGDTPDNPIRLVPPNPAVVMQHYPPDALQRGVTGRATVQCEIVSGGVLDHCLVQDEQPTGQGFGDAAIQVAFEYRVRPSADGSFPTGKKVSFPVDFSAPR